MSVPFEVIVIDLNSFDNTTLLLNRFQKQYSYLKYIKIEQDPKQILMRNYAFSVGIREAIYTKIMYIDNTSFTDCSENWLEQMTLPFNDSTIRNVIGYTTFRKENTIKNKWRRYIHLHQILMSWGFALFKKPIFTKTSNVVFDKSALFLDTKFVRIDPIKKPYTQAFELLKNQKNDICFQEDSFIYEKMNPNTEVEREKWFSSLFTYGLSILSAINFIYFVSQILFWILVGIILYSYCIHAITEYTLFFYSIGAFIFREILYIFYCIRVACSLKEKDIIFWIPFLDIFYTFYMLYYIRYYFRFRRQDI